MELFNISNNTNNNHRQQEFHSYHEQYLNFLQFQPKFERIIMYISLISCFSNLISLIIFKYSVSFKVKYNIYLSSGLLVDLFTNLDNQFIYWSLRLVKNNYLTRCILSIYVHQPVLRFCFCFSIAISLIISIDRLNAIQSPLSLKSSITQRKIKSILLLSCVWSLVNTLFHFMLYYCTNEGKPDYRNSLSQRIDLYLTFSFYLLAVFIPTLFILGFNLKLVYIVYHRCYGKDKEYHYQQQHTPTSRSPTPVLRTTQTMTSISSKANSIKLHENESKAHEKASKSAKLNCIIVFIITIPLIIVVFIQFGLYIDSLLKRPFSMKTLYIHKIVQPILFTLLSFNNFLACILINRKFRRNLLKPVFLLKLSKEKLCVYIKPRHKARL